MVSLGTPAGGQRSGKLRRSKLSPQVKSMPDVDETEIAGAAKEIRLKYGDVIGENQARNIAYTALVGARCAKIRTATVFGED